MNSLKALLVISLSLLTIQSFAQSGELQNALGKLDKKNATDSTQNPQANDSIGEITLHADSSIVQLERNTRGFKETKGYRIQIMLGSMENIKAERNKYLSLGLPYSAYMKQVVPEYSLQIGDFRNKMEVEKHLQIVREHYPKAFAVVDSIEPQRFQTKK